MAAVYKGRPARSVGAGNAVQGSGEEGRLHIEGWSGDDQPCPWLNRQQRAVHGCVGTVPCCPVESRRARRSRVAAHGVSGPTGG